MVKLPIAITDVIPRLYRALSTNRLLGRFWPLVVPLALLHRD